MEQLQNELNILLKKIADKGFKIDNNFNIYKPDNNIYVSEEYYKQEGKYENQGKIIKSHSLDILEYNVYKTICENIKSGGKDFIRKLYDRQTGIDIIDNTFNAGYSDMAYYDYDEEFINGISIKQISETTLRLDFGVNYDYGYEGYLEFKIMTLDEFNNFEEIDIDTFN